MVTRWSWLSSHEASGNEASWCFMSHSLQENQGRKEKACGSSLSWVWPCEVVQSTGGDVGKQDYRPKKPKGSEVNTCSEIQPRLDLNSAPRTTAWSCRFGEKRLFLVGRGSISSGRILTGSISEKNQGEGSSEINQFLKMLLFWGHGWGSFSSFSTITFYHSQPDWPDSRFWDGSSRYLSLRPACFYWAFRVELLVCLCPRACDGQEMPKYVIQNIIFLAPQKRNPPEFHVSQSLSGGEAPS